MIIHHFYLNLCVGNSLLNFSRSHSPIVLEERISKDDLYEINSLAHSLHVGILNLYFKFVSKLSKYSCLIFLL